VEVFTKQGQWKEAAEAQARLAELTGNDPQFWLEAGRTAAKAKEWKLVATAFAKALALLPDEPSQFAPHAQACLELAQWDEAFARATELLPKDTTLWLGRARYRALRSQWEGAAADYAKVIDQRPPHDEWVEHACARLLVGDVEGYRKFCAWAVERAGSSKQPFTGFVLARLCALSTASGIEASRMIEWGQQAVASTTSAPWFLHALAAAHYRAGEYTKAIQRLQQANQPNWREEQVLNWLFLAMCHHRLDNAGEARKWLDRATMYLEPA